MVNSSAEYGTGGFTPRALCILNRNNNNVNNCKKKINYFIISRVPYDMFSREKLVRKLSRSRGSCRNSSIMKV